MADNENPTHCPDLREHVAHEDCPGRESHGISAEWLAMLDEEDE